jgi:hypothetical protein
MTPAIRKVPVLAVVAVCLTCSQVTAGEWITSKEGAKLWNPYPQPNETCSWTGKKDANGYATGAGMIVWFQGSTIHEVSTGSHTAGREDGVFYTMTPNGDVSVTYFESGQKIQINNRLVLKDDEKPSKDSPNAQWIISKEGVKLWNPNPQPSETCSWTGKRDHNGYATGPGMVVWYQGATIAEVNCQSYESGKADGVGALARPSGKKWVTFKQNGTYLAVDLKLERADQVVRAQSPSTTSEKSRSYYRPSTQDDSEAFKRAIAKIIGAGLANSFAKDQDKNDGLLAALFSVGARAGRDKLIESAIKDVFPEFEDFEIRGIRRVASLYLDGKLSLENLGKETAKEEIIEALNEENPGLGTSAKVVDFLYELHKAASNHKVRN